MKKRILSMILAVAMVVSMFAGITLISSAASDLTSGKYVLAADIETGVIDRDKLLKWFKVERLEDITEAQFREYVEKRDKKRADK